MYRIVTVKDRIKVPPENFGMEVEEAVKKSIEQKFEGLTDPHLGVILAVVSVDEISEGRILPNDACIHYDVTFKLLTFLPELHELVWGEVIDNTEFGSFVRIGPMDGLVHISQLMNDFVSYDSKNSVFIGKQTKKTLKEGDKLRARVISVSLAKQQKIGLTMRQPLLGNLTWIEEEKRKKKK
jgi:DNA-directed RNA polymerase subunit E'